MNTELIDKAIDECKGIWGGGECTDYLYNIVDKDFGYLYAESKVNWRGHAYVCTQEGFEARVAERQNKPSWDDAPKWATHLGQGWSGQWLWFEGTARVVKQFGNETWASNKYPKQESKGEVIIPWQDTLEKRPEVDVKGFKDGDCIDITGLTVEQIKAVDIVAGKLFDTTRPPSLCDSMVFRDKHDYLQYNPDPSSGNKHTLSEWLFKTAPDWAVDVRKVNGAFRWTDGISRQVFFADGGEGYSSKIPTWGVIATREPINPEQTVQSIKEPSPIKDHPLADEIKDKIESGELVADGDAGDEYVPKVGEKCEIRTRWGDEWGNWLKAVFKGGYDSKMWFGVPGDDLVLPAHDLESRPIKSEKEKFVQEAMEINNRMIDADMNDTSLIFGAVFEELVDKQND